MELIDIIFTMKNGSLEYFIKDVDNTEVVFGRYNSYIMPNGQVNDKDSGKLYVALRHPWPDGSQAWYQMILDD